jgi:solute carrier family 15 (peptide/histidine transporter), member 3/4
VHPEDAGMLPIWLCTIVYSVVFSVHPDVASIAVRGAGRHMNTNIGSFHFPAASMSLFDVLSVLAFIAIYRRVLEPVMARLSGNPQGLTELQRMGVGRARDRHGGDGGGGRGGGGAAEARGTGSPVPAELPECAVAGATVVQYALIGASEVFMYVGQLEFFNGQAPDGVKSFGSALCMASISLGNYVSIMLVSVVISLTAGEKRPGWIPLNSGHLDRFYFLLAALSLVDLAVYIACAMWYKGIKLDGDNRRKVSAHV